MTYRSLTHSAPRALFDNADVGGERLHRERITIFAAPPRPLSATATEIWSLWTSNPTNLVCFIRPVSYA